MNKIKLRAITLQGGIDKSPILLAKFEKFTN